MGNQGNTKNKSVKQWDRVRKVLMCPPKYFRIEFRINPYMDPGNPKKQVDSQKAWREWNCLYLAIKGMGVKIDLLRPVRGIPDLVFPADMGFVVNPSISRKTVVLSNFRWPERQKETPHYERYLRKKKYKIIKIPRHISFEINVRETDNFYLLGYGIRNDKEGIKYLRKYFDKPVYPLKLVSPWFYHLSCALAVLNNDTVMYYPKAFDDKSVKLLKKLFKNNVILTKKEVLNLAGNCIVINNKILINYMTHRLRKIFNKLNFDFMEISVDEFIKAGGAVNCMVFVLSKKWGNPVFTFKIN